MADRFVLSHLKRFPLFAPLSPQQLEAVANAAQVMRYQPGELIFTQGQPAPGAVIFASGRGELVQVGPDQVARQVGVVEEGEYLNEAALFTDVIAPVTLRAIEVSIVLYVSRQQMASVLAYYPDIKNALQSRPAASSPMAAVPGNPATPFQGLRENENVLIETRRHWWAFARRFGITLLVIILLFVLGSVASRAIPDGPWLALVGPVLLVAVGFLAYFYAEWRNDQLIVTERRVINIQRTIIGLSTNINELPLDSILEVNVSVPMTNITARIFGYGSITIKASGDGNLMKLDYVPNPKHIQNTIFTYRDRLRQNQVDESRSATRNAIRGEIDQFLGNAPVPGNTPGGMGGQPVTFAQGETGFLPMKFFNERGETVYRKHRIIWFQHIFLALLMIVGSLVLFAVAVFSTTNLGFIGFALAFVVLAVGVVWFYLADWDWRHDMYIVGDQTITLIHKRPLWLQDENDQILLSQVDNVISEMSGVFDTLFQVGDVKISLTGSDAKNAKWFRKVHKPQEVQQEISRRQDRARALKQDAEAQRQKQAIVDYLSVYHETVGGGGEVRAQTDDPGTQPSTGGNPSAEQPPRVRDRSRPPGIPLVRRDNPPGS